MPFKECGELVGSATPCEAGSRRISHYQMTVNYDNRLFSVIGLLQAPGLSVPVLTGTQSNNFAGNWKDWQQCPPCN